MLQVMSEVQEEKRSAPYVYRFRFEPRVTSKTELGEVSNAELQKYIDNLLGIKREPEEKRE